MSRGLGNRCRGLDTNKEMESCRKVLQHCRRNVSARLESNVNRWVIVPVLLISFIVSCNAGVSYLSTKQEQQIAIGSLLTVSANMHEYNLRDRDGRMFGEYMEAKGNLFFIIAALFSGEKIFPGDNYTLRLVFPVCAKDDPGFNAMLEDLQNPSEFFHKLGSDYIPSPKDTRDYNAARTYFLSPLDRILALEIIFKKDCEERFYYQEGDVILERITVAIPVSSTERTR